ncbi:MAG: MFS transporter, partial [Patescibacteria group bacterium]
MQNERILRANVWKLYLLSAGRGFMVMMPTIVLFFQENGLTMAEIFILQSVFSVAIVVFEIPSGYFADKIGRKASLVIGTICAFISFVVYSFAYGFWPILVAEIILGIGYAFKSGADSALLYDTLVEIKETDTYKKREGNLLAASTFAEAVASIIGGFIALMSLRAPIVAQAAVTFFLIPVALTLKEPMRRMLSPEHALWNMRSVIAHTLHHNRFLKWLIFFYAIVNSLGLILVWFRQPYLQDTGVPLAYFGFIWAVLMLAVSFASLSAHSFEGRFGRLHSLWILLLMGVIGFGILGSSISLWLIPAMLLFSIIRGLQEPIIKDYVQQHAESDFRATVLSIKGFVSRALFAILGPIAGWASDIYSLQFALLASGGFLLVFGAFSLIMVRRYERPARV